MTGRTRKIGVMSGPEGPCGAFLAQLTATPNSPYTFLVANDVADFATTLLENAVECIICTPEHYESLLRVLDQPPEWRAPLLLLDEQAQRCDIINISDNGITGCFNPFANDGTHEDQFLDHLDRLIFESQCHGQLRAVQQHQNHILNSIDDCVLTLDVEGRVLQANQSAASLFGATCNELQRQTFSNLFVEHPLLDSASWDKVAASCEPFEQTATGHFKRLDGMSFFASYRLSLIPPSIGHEFNALLILRGARSKKPPNAQSDIYDHLPRGDVMHDMLRRSVECARSGETLSLLCINVARFAQINDVLGNAVGDLLIRAIAKRLRECIPPQHILGRVGGDEFVVILQNNTDPNSLAETVVTAMTAPFFVLDYELHRDVHIGIATYPGSGTDAATLLLNAHKAVAAAKRLPAGKRIFTFVPSLGVEAMNRLLLEADLHHAIERSQFSMAYQPLVRARDLKVVGLEALLRWQHHSLGNISTEILISIAEDVGLIHDIGSWVLRTVCTQYVTWLHENRIPTRLKVAVNVSAQQLDHPHFMSSVRQILSETGMPPAQLEFEITESCLMSDVEHARSVLRQLHALGISISVDDFGTGYSSLSHLRNLPIDTLKIDRSFVRDLPDDQNDSAIARATIALAHNLGLKVIAEGVEKESQLRFLELNDCDDMQGYYFSRPLPADTVCEFISSTNSRKCA